MANLPMTGLDLFRGDLLSSVQREMDRAIRQFGSLTGLGRETQEREGTLTPLAEVSEDETAYRISLELAGFEPNQIEANVSGRTLTVRAERQDQSQQAALQGGQQGAQQGQQTREQQQRRSQVLLNERTYRQVRRQFQLPDDIDSNRVEAQFRNGLLTLTVPKSQQAREQQRRIDIKNA